MGDGGFTTKMTHPHGKGVMVAWDLGSLFTCSSLVTTWLLTPRTVFEEAQEEAARFFWPSPRSPKIIALQYFPLTKLVTTVRSGSRRGEFNSISPNKTSKESVTIIHLPHVLWVTGQSQGPPEPLELMSSLHLNSANTLKIALLDVGPVGSFYHSTFWIPMSRFVQAGTGDTKGRYVQEQQKWPMRGQSWEEMKGNVGIWNLRKRRAQYSG